MVEVDTIWRKLDRDQHRVGLDHSQAQVDSKANTYYPFGEVAPTLIGIIPVVLSPLAKVPPDCKVVREHSNVPWSLPPAQRLMT